jgi:hypothetical protein
MRKMLTVFMVGLGIFAFGGVVYADNSLEVTADAAMEGNYGLRVHIDPGTLTQAYVQSDHPQQESHFRVSFWLDATNLDMPFPPNTNKCFVFMKFYRDSPSPLQHTFVYICRNNVGTAYRIALNTRKNSEFWYWLGGTFLSGDASPNPHFIEIEWQQADPGMSNGIARMWRDGNLVREATDVNNSDWNVDQVRVGIPPDPKLGPTVSGSFDFDSYVSTR